MTHRLCAALVPVALALLGADRPVRADDCVYVANSSSDYVSVIDAASHSWIGDIAVEGSPRALAVDPSGQFLYVVTADGAFTRFDGSACQSEVHEGCTSTHLSLFDTTSYRLAGEIPVPFSADKPLIAPDGRFAYLSDLYESPLYVIDLARRRFVRTIPLNGDDVPSYLDTPLLFALSRDGSQLYVPLADGLIGNVAIVDTATGAVTDTIPLLPDVEAPDPFAVALGPDDRTAYVLLSGLDLVPVLDTGSRTVADVLQVRGTSLVASPDGAQLYVAGASLKIIDTRTKATTTVPLGSVFGAPVLALALDGDVAYITHFGMGTGTVSGVDLRTRAVVAQIPVGVHPRDIAVGRLPGPCQPAGYTPQPTRTPTPIPTVTPTRTPSSLCPAGIACLKVSSISTQPGGEGRIQVQLHTAGQDITGVQNEIRFDPHLSLDACAPGPALGGLGGFFSAPSLVRAVGLAKGQERIPDGTVLYTCTVTVAGDTPPGTYLLYTDMVIASSPTGFRVPIAGADGEVIVSEQAGAHTEASSGPGSGRSGCQIARQSSFPWLWIVPAVSVLFRRRADPRTDASARCASWR